MNKSISQEDLAADQAQGSALRVSDREMADRLLLAAGRMLTARLSACRDGAPTNQTWQLLVMDDETEAVVVQPLDSAVQIPNGCISVEFSWYVIDVTLVDADGTEHFASVVADSSMNRIKQLEQLFVMLGDSLACGSDATMRNRAAVCGILAVAAEELVAAPSGDAETVDRKRRTFYRIRSYIGEHHRRPFTLEECAASLELSPIYVNRICKTFTSMRFTSYVNLTRLERARKLLTSHPRMKALEVAAACGYNQASHFTQKFRSVYGLTPRDFRKSQLGIGRSVDYLNGIGIKGFTTLDPEPQGQLLQSEPETLPQYNMLLVNPTAQAVMVCWLSPNGLLDTMGWLGPRTGRWTMGVSPGQGIVLRTVDGNVVASYKTPAKLSQIIVPEFR